MKRLNRMMIAALAPLVLLSACDRKKEHREAAPHVETTQATAWTAATEALVEAVPGEKGDSEILVHLTKVQDHKPVAAEKVTLTLQEEGGQPQTATLTQKKPGMYAAKMKIDAARKYDLIISYAGGFSDSVVIKGFGTDTHDHAHEGHEAEKKDSHKGEKPGAHAEKGAHEGEKHGEHEGHAHEGESAGEHAAHGDEHEGHDHEAEGDVVFGTGGGSIAFPKEQQWKVDFLVRRPERRTIDLKIAASGEIMPVADGEVTISAPVSGVVSASRPLPFLGKRVGKGEVIAFIDPPVRGEGGIGGLTTEYAEAKRRVTVARQERDRASRLFEAKVAPKKRVEEAEAALESAEAALAPLERGMKEVGSAPGGRIPLRSPISGTVVEVFSGTGKGIEAGQPLMRIVNTSTVWIKANVPAVEAGSIPRDISASFTLPGDTDEHRTGKVVSVGDMLDPRTRTLPVIFAVANPQGKFKVGTFVTVGVKTGSASGVLSVPKAALVEDEGRFFAFVQTSGERFERREVVTGGTDGAWIQVRSGLKPADRVVVNGAYYLKMASQAGGAPDPHAGHNH